MVAEAEDLAGIRAYPNSEQRVSISNRLGPTACIPHGGNLSFKLVIGLRAVRHFRPREVLGSERVDHRGLGHPLPQCFGHRFVRLQAAIRVSDAASDSHGTVQPLQQIRLAQRDKRSIEILEIVSDRQPIPAGLQRGDPGLFGRKAGMEKGQLDVGIDTTFRVVNVLSAASTRTCAR